MSGTDRLERAVLGGSSEVPDEGGVASAPSAAPEDAAELRAEDALVEDDSASRLPSTGFLSPSTTSVAPSSPPSSVSSVSFECLGTALAPLRASCGWEARKVASRRDELEKPRGWR